jgi:hypothetical protein
MPDDPRLDEALVLLLALGLAAVAVGLGLYFGIFRMPAATPPMPAPQVTVA